MSSNSQRKYQRRIDFIEDFIGADVSRDLIEVALVSQDISQLTNNIDQIGGADQSAVDIADKIDQLEDALDSVGSDELRVLLEGNNAGTLPVEQQSPVVIEADDDGGNTSSLQAEEIDTSIGGVETALITYLARALNEVGNDELVSRITDSTGSQVDPSLSVDYPDSAQEQDLIVTGDLVVGPTPVGRSEAVIIAANSDDDNVWSASVEWQDDSGNVIQTESASDIGLNSVDNEYSRLVRKGQQVQVTFSDQSGATNNNINAFVDAHR